MDELIKKYAEKNRNKCFALKKWAELNMKDYSLKEMLVCISKYANNSFEKMNDIIDHLCVKRKVFGRTQVYSSQPINMSDIVRDENGELVLKGYRPDAPLPLKGQHHRDNPKIFRKSDGQVSKNFKKSEDKMLDFGKKVRELYPNEDNHFLTFAMQAIKKYANDRKISTDKVVNGLKKGRYRIDTDVWRIVPKPSNESTARRTIVITENDASRLYQKIEMTEYKFFNNMKHFISLLLQDPVNAQPSTIFKIYNLSRSALLKYLLTNKILEKDERISDKDENGQPKTATMMVKYRCPKKNFERKLKKLYIKLFEKNLPERKHEEQEITVSINEEGEGGACGATSAESSGQFIQPFGDVQRRKMPTEIDETTTTFNTGNYQYTVPFGGDKETLSRKNGKGGSVSINEV